MVIQEDNDLPMEAFVMHKVVMERENNLVQQDYCNNTNKGAKSRKRHKTRDNMEQSSLEIESNCTRSTNISHSDLEELRTVYRQCKGIIKKIEAKYGHLLNREDDSNSGNEQTNNSSKCTCTFNKKIVFDDNGQPITREVIPEIHICPKKQKLNPSMLINSRLNVQIEDESMVNSLPCDIKELCDILKNPDIGIVYRNKVIERIKVLRMDNSNTMRFDRKCLIEKFKFNPEECVEFKGSNLSSLPGYPITADDNIKE